MAATVVTPTVVPFETNELVPAGVAGGGSNAGWTILSDPYPVDRMLLVFKGDGTNADNIHIHGAPVTVGNNVNAGLVPTVTAGLGDYDFALGATETRCVVVEATRHWQSGLGIVVTNTGTGATTCYALIVPAGGGIQNGL